MRCGYVNRTPSPHTNSSEQQPAVYRDFPFAASEVAILPDRQADYKRPWALAVERAHRLCAECGLTAGEVDGLIETMQAAGERKTRDELFEVWLDTYEVETERVQVMDLCRPCVEAVLDAAGR